MTFPYQTSRDYALLVAELDKGHTIACIAPLVIDGLLISRDVAGACYHPGYGYSVRVRGYEYTWAHTAADFIAECEKDAIEFIPPPP